MTVAPRPAPAATPLLTYYGDDLTGSTDVMEALASRGIETVLFVEAPSAERLARFPAAAAVGVAGTSRSESPAWMARALPPVFAGLRALGAPLCHYKVCSTFDSSPRTGSIGQAIDIGAAVFGQATVPLVVGAPQLKRYTAFGHLFAGFRGETYRIDRHPVMSRHPVTPMAEADLRIHLAAQTSRSIALVDLAALQREDGQAAVDRGMEGAPGVLMLDVADAASQAAVGRALWRLAGQGHAFVAGSSGIEYALLAEWERLGIAAGRADFAPLSPKDRIAIVSGSCSPTTEAQIRYALDHGFDGVALDPLRLVGADRAAALAEALSRAGAVLAGGRSVIVHTALGPGTDLGAALDEAGEGRHAIGRALGGLLRDLVLAHGLSRVVVAGGDTSSHALRELGIVALTTRMPLPASPGSPLCTAHSAQAAFDGLEIAFKGGQIGGDGYFVDLRDGRR